jgi:uncharacterized protein YrrD
MRFTECAKHPVLDTTTAEEVGRVDGFIIDPSGHRIHAVRVGKHKGGSILPWGEVQACGPDAVTISSDAAVRAPGEPLDEAHDVLGQRVLSEEGFELGVVDDVEFDPESGELQQIDLVDRSVDARTLIGSGRYALVVRHTEAPTPR